MLVPYLARRSILSHLPTFIKTRTASLSSSSIRMLTLYDITSTLDPPAWSPNVWKTRLLLNYKNVPYRTEWMPVSDIEDRMKALGAAPTGTLSDGRPLYTLPVISDGSHVVSESSNIAAYLETAYPTRSAFPSNTRALQSCFIDHLATALQPVLRPLVVPSVALILDPRGHDYFRRTREAQFGVALENLFPVGSDVRERQWAEVARVLDRIDVWLNGSAGEGPWLGGAEPVYADFVLASYFLWFIKAGVPDGWNRVQHWNDGRWRKLIENCAPYMKGD